jgi:hypothetical protein
MSGIDCSLDRTEWTMAAAGLIVASVLLLESDVESDRDAARKYLDLAKKIAKRLS